MLVEGFLNFEEPGTGGNFRPDWGEVFRYTRRHAVLPRQPLLADPPGLLGFAERSKAMTEVAQQTGSDQTALRPFQVNVPEAELTELRRRIHATRWPDRETDASQGVQLATMQELARYWATEYDWRRVEARLNALPQFSPRSMGSTFISFTFVRSTKTRCRSSSRTDGPARSSSS